jgi:hypothetical protein
MATKKLQIIGNIGGGGGAVTSVNGQTGAVDLTAADVGGVWIDMDGTSIEGSPIPTNADLFDNKTYDEVKSDFIDACPVKSVNGQTGDVIVTAGVSSINGKTGDITLSASDFGATSTDDVNEIVNDAVNALREEILGGAW